MKTTPGYLFIIFAVSTLAFYSCSSDKKQAPATPTTDTIHAEDMRPDSLTKAYEKEFDEVNHTFKGASIPEALRIVKIAYFSNPETPDTFSLTVPSGQIASIQCLVNIITAKGDTIYKDTVSTSRLAQDVIYPDSIPKAVFGKSNDLFNLTYLNALTKTHIENYTKIQLNTFFDHVFVERKEIEAPEIREEVTDKELFDAIENTPDAKIIFFPCFSCDEGGSYYGYSEKEKKAVAFISGD